MRCPQKAHLLGLPLRESQASRHVSGTCEGSEVPAKKEADDIFAEPKAFAENRSESEVGVKTRDRICFPPSLNDFDGQVGMP